MHYLFYICSNLKNLDLSHFDTSSVTDMRHIFDGCSSLTELNLSNFKTFNLTRMSHMFSNCISLKELDLSNFDTSYVKIMQEMFANCTSLSNINLANFNFSKIINITQIFYGCNNLEFLNLSNSNSLNNFIKKKPFSETSKNLVICSDKEDLFTLDECNIIYCHENWREKQKKLYNDTCYDNCSEIQKYEYKSKCYDQCPNGTYDNNYICEECATNCLLCPNLTSCLKYKENDELNESKNLDKTYSSYITYPSTKEESLDNKCYSTCQNCKIQGNDIEHHCDSCKIDFPYEISIKDYKNCYAQNITNKNITKVNEIINLILSDIIDNYNSSIDDIIKIPLDIEEKKILITLIKTSDEIKKKNKNETAINLGQCEDKLKNFHHIPNDSSLYILKLEVNETGMKIPKIEYNLYYPLDGKNLEKLNISVCKNTKIEINIPVCIDDDIEKYNKSSNYYNDICSKTTSKYGTDICLKDRQEEFINNNMTICEENCDLIDYKNGNAKCSCEAKIRIELPLIEDITFNKNELKRSFTDISYFANINMMKCYKSLLNLKDLINNYGFLFLLGVIIIFFIIFILFLVKYYSVLKNEILKIVSKEQNNEKKDGNNLNNIIKTRENNNKRNTAIFSTKNNSFNKNNNKSKTKQIKIKDKNNKKKNKKRKTAKLIKEDLSTGIKNNNFEFSNRRLENVQIKKTTEVLDLNDNEMNSLSYKDALKNDRRTYMQYYCSLLKSNHLFLFAFCNNKDYNSKIIKIFLFIFSFSINLTTNALFFNDGTMHQIYIDKGNFNFIYQLSKIIYSSLISTIINIALKNLALSEKDIIKIKKKKRKNKIKDLEQEKNKLLNKLKVKFGAFFFLSFIFLLIFLAYITCFCGIFKNTQIHLIKDTVIGFGLSLLYPFGICLIPGIFRIPALNAKKKDSEYMYKFSKILQIF
jgi:surface protein